MRFRCLRMALQTGKRNRSGEKAAALAPAPDIVDNLLDMCDFCIREVGDLDISFVVEFQQKVGAYREKGCDFQKHIDGRKDIIILPVGNGLLGNA